MHLKLIAIAVGCLGLAGCVSSVVKSERVALPNVPEGLPYALPKGLIAVTVKADYCQDSNQFFGNYSYELGALTIVPDNNALVLSHPIANTSDDDLDFTTSNGLLTTVHTIADDKSAKVTTTLAELYKEAAKGAAAYNATPANLLDRTVRQCDKPDRKAVLIQQVDIFDSQNLASVRESIRATTGEDIIVQSVQPVGGLASPGAGVANGIYYRHLANYDVRIVRHQQTVALANYNLPDRTKLGYIAVKRQNFTRSESTLAFTNGIPTNEHYVRNNAASGLAQAGLDSVKTVASIPHAVVTGLIGGAEDEKGLIKARTEQMTAEKGVIEARTAEVAALKDLEEARRKAAKVAAPTEDDDDGPDGN